MAEAAVRGAGDEPAGGGRFLTFRVAGRRYALPAAAVAEVIPIPAVARLPRSPKSLLGLANLRGAVIPVVDPCVLLGRGAFIPGPAARAIVLAGANPVGVCVEAVERLILVPAGRIETGSAVMAAEPGERLAGAFRNDRSADGASPDADR